MPIPVRCPGCQSTLQVADQFAGRKGRCKKCQAVFPIPAADTPKEEPPEVLPVDEPARADLNQGLQTTPGRVRRPILQDDDEDRPRRRPDPDDERDKPRRRRPRSVDARPRKGAFLLVAGAVAAFLLLAAGTGTALWWFLRAAPNSGDAAQPGAQGDGKAFADVNAPPGAGPAGATQAALARDNRLLPLDASKVVCQLPSNVADVAVGGDGRYLILHLPQQQKLAIFDVKGAQIAHYVDAPGGDVKFTAGLTKLVVALGGQHVLQRWDLATGQREASVPAPAGGLVSCLAMGSASEGPLLVSQKSERLGPGPPPTFLELRTLMPLSIQTAGEVDVALRRAGHWRASADGQTFAMWRPSSIPSGIFTLILKGGTARCYYAHDSAGYLAPSPDGKVIYSACGPVSPQVTRRDDLQRNGPCSVPAVQGIFYLTMPGVEPLSEPLDKNQGPPPPAFKDTPGVVALHLEGDSRPLLHLSGLELPEKFDPWDPAAFGPPKRLFLIPSAKVIITIPSANDRLVLYRFDFDQALDKAGGDYLLVTSRPPASVQRKTAFVYQLMVKSKKGGVTYKLDSGPPGMQLSPEGRVTWQVPANWAESAADVIVSVRDASGQEVFQSFKVANADGPVTEGQPFPRFGRNNLPPGDPDDSQGRIEELMRRLSEPNLRPEVKAELMKRIQAELNQGAPPRNPPQAPGKLPKSEGPILRTRTLPSAERNKVYTFKLRAIPAGGTTFTLLTGPDGMTVSPEGLLTWSVPANFTEKSVLFRCKVMDGSGKSITEVFVLRIKD